MQMCLVTAALLAYPVMQQSLNYTLDKEVFRHGLGTLSYRFIGLRGRLNFTCASTAVDINRVNSDGGI